MHFVAQMSVVLVVSSALILQTASASITVTDEIPTQEVADQMMTRGAAVDIVVKAFDLEKKERKFVIGCLTHMDDCFFTFSAMSDYDGIQFSPLVLYPDVFPAHPYYKSINLASILGLVHGYIDESQSPFYPQQEMSRIQALKVIFGAANLLTWKEKFEIADDPKGAVAKGEIYSDVSDVNPNMWWYSRYLQFALDQGILEPATSFRPDESITKSELLDLISSTQKYQPITTNDSQTVPPADSSQQTLP